MITKEEFYQIEDRQERFEIAQLYMLLHSFATPYFVNLDLDGVKKIFSCVRMIKENMQNNFKEGCEYISIEMADKAFDTLKEQYEQEHGKRYAIVVNEKQKEAIRVATEVGLSTDSWAAKQLRKLYKQLQNYDVQTT